MKKAIILILLAFVSFVSNAADRSNLTIKTGTTELYRGISLNASDTIVTSETITFTITNIQKYAQNQVFTIDLDSISGNPAVTITAYGKVTSSGAWVQIGSPISWTSDSNDGSISSTSPINYNYLKVTFVASGATQKTQIVGFEVKTSNAYDIPAASGTLTISRADAGAVTITTKDNDANAATTYRAGGTGALTIGAATGTTAITSSDWAISATGVATGMGAITSDGLITGTAGATLSGAAVNLNASSNFAVNVGTGSTNAAVSVGGGSNTVAVNSSTWDVTTAGVVTGLTKVTVTADADNVILDPGADLHAIDVQINSASKFSVDTTGVVALSNAETISNATDGTVEISGVTKAGLKMPAPILNTDGAETLDATMSGKMCISSKSDGATTWTIPDPSAATVGVVYYIMQTADQDLIVTATTADSNSIVCDGVATSDSVTISTVSHKIGAGMIVVGISATQWYVGGLNPESILTPEAAD